MSHGFNAEIQSDRVLVRQGIYFMASGAILYNFILELFVKLMCRKVYQYQICTLDFPMYCVLETSNTDVTPAQCR